MTHSLPSDRERDATLGARLGITPILVSAEETILEMPVLGNKQPAGFLHGGATAALCEEAASTAANEHAKESGAMAVGTGLSVTHLRPVRSGNVTAVASAEHLGKRSTVHYVRVIDADGTVISTCLASNALIDPS